MSFKQPSPEMVEVLRQAGSYDFNTAMLGQHKLAKALTLPLKQGILRGDNLANVFEDVYFPPGTSVEFPMDFVQPGQEKDHFAYTIPSWGRIPERHFESDYVTIQTYDIGNSIDTSLRYIRDARWDVVSRAKEVLRSGFVRKFNTDGWHVLLAAGAGRNIITYDDAATAGLFTKRLVALMKTVMRRNAGGGNASSTNQGMLTDLWLSPEALEDIRSWDLSQIDDVSRREIFLAGGGSTGEQAVARIFGVSLHILDELGVNQEYQKYFANTLGGTMPTDKVEIVVGLDLANRDSFVSPFRQDIEVFEDPTFHRMRRWGLYGWCEKSWSSLNSARVLLGAL